MHLDWRRVRQRTVITWKKLRAQLVGFMLRVVARERFPQNWRWLVDRRQVAMHKVGPNPMRRRSLVSRLLLLQFMGAVLVYLLAVTGLWWTSTSVIQDYIHKQAIQRITELDELGTPLYVSRDRKQAARVEQWAKNYPEVAFIRYYASDAKKVLAEFRDARRTDVKLPVFSEKQLDILHDTSGKEKPLVFDDSAIGTVVRVIAPVWVQSIRSDGLMNFDLDGASAEDVRIIGYIDLGLDRAYYTNPLVRNIILSSLALALALFVLLFVGRYFIRKALAPLSELKTPLARLARGDTNVKVSNSGDEEIFAISRALNTTINAVKERDKALRKLAEHDSLTGLLNRNSFTHELEKVSSEIVETGRSCALLFVDLDKFKYINDTLGHAAGDRLLIQVADILKSRMRDGDIISRFGGDEFTILARNVEQKAAVGIAESILNIMRDMRFSEDEQAFSICCSIGITMIDSDHYTADELLSQADVACFEAKSRGRNRYELFEIEEQDKQQLTADMSWSQMISDAMKKDRFVLVYQPIIKIGCDNGEFYEVLLRMPGKNGDLLTASSFLSAAERFGLMVEIDYWVIDHALKALADYCRSGRNVRFSINLSGKVFEDQRLVDHIRKALKINRLPGSAVVFEITEQIATRHLERTSLLIRALQDLGCRFALDNFGAGFSSFSYIKHLPVDYIKIEGSFIENIASDPIDAAMIASIVQVAQTVGKETIAEYVQDAKTLKLLKELGVDFAQGNYIGEPGDILAEKAFAVITQKSRNRRPVIVKH